MNRNNIAIATITWARDEAEEQLLKDSLRNLALLRIPVYVTDGGSGPNFLSFLQEFPHFNLLTIKERGVWAQARNSLQQCFQAGAEFILYTEPDKMDFIKNFLPAMLDEIHVDENSGIVMACRSPKGFATYPGFQQMTETTINNCCAEVIGKNIDYTYGPFLLNRKLVPYLDHVNEDIGWGWRPYIFNMAHRLNLRIENYERDFSCPADQRNDTASERIYRMRQLTQNIQAIVLSSVAKVNTH